MGMRPAPFPDGSFDAVLCQQGLQYFPDRAAAMKEMARVLAPRGRLSVAVWGALERQPFYVALKDGLAAYLPEQQTPTLWPFSLNTAEELRTLASDAGLQDVWSASNIGRSAAFDPDSGSSYVEANPDILQP